MDKSPSGLARQMALGNPDNATNDPSNRNHYLITWPECAISYDNDLRICNWTAWHLGAGDMGDAPRDPYFEPDRDLPPGYVEVLASDYDRSGYDRGHMCPSADRTATVADNVAVFETVNIIPQRHSLNAGPWEKLESYCRDLASAGSDLFIVCGPVAPTGAAATARRIGKDGVVVPDACWKIVVVAEPGLGTPESRISAISRVIVVLMPNDSSVTLRDKWEKYSCSVADIEKVTGLNFFTGLDPAIAAVLGADPDALEDGGDHHDRAH